MLIVHIVRQWRTIPDMELKCLCNIIKVHQGSCISLKRAVVVINLSGEFTNKVMQFYGVKTVYNLINSMISLMS